MLEISADADTMGGVSTIAAPPAGQILEARLASLVEAAIAALRSHRVRLVVGVPV